MILHKKVWGQHKFTPTLFSKGGQLPPVHRLLRPCFLWYTLEPPDLTREEWIFFFPILRTSKILQRIISFVFVLLFYYFSFFFVCSYLCFVCSYLCCLSFILFFFFSFCFVLIFWKISHCRTNRLHFDIKKKNKQKHNKNIRSWFFFSAMPDANYIFLSHLIPWIFLLFLLPAQR